MLIGSLRPSEKGKCKPGRCGVGNVLQGGRDHPSLNPGAQHFALTSRESRCLFRGRKVQGLRPSAALGASLGVAQSAKEMCQVKPVTPLLPPVLRGTASPCSTWLLFLHTSAGKNPARSVPGSQEAAVPAAGAEGAGYSPTNASGNTSGNATPRLPTASSIACHIPTHSRTHSAGVHRLCPAFGLDRFPFVPALLWAVPAQAPEGVCPTHKLPVFAGGWEPEVSHPLCRQSPPSSPCQTPSAANAPLRSAPLVVWRLCTAQTRHSRDSKPPTPFILPTLPLHLGIQRHHPPVGR